LATVSDVIVRFGEETALLIVDAQVGVDDLDHWGGATGRRNNSDAELHLQRLLERWRATGRPVAFSLHDSWEQHSPLKRSLPSGASKAGLEPGSDEIVVIKHVNGAFFGTDLEIQLRRAGVRRLVVGGFFTNFCVETTVRTAGNIGFDTYLCHDACAATNRIGHDGVDHDPDVVHQLAVATMHGEFCTAVTTDDALGLLGGDRADLDRVQGNE
jgi:nicotinamidase-related amidase